jgi:hypothetical protein
MSPEQHDHHNNNHNNHNHRPADDDDAIRRRDVLRRLYTATVLCSCFIIVEVIGGLMSGSLAVLSDAAHLFADLASFAVASKFFLFVHYTVIFTILLFCDYCFERLLNPSFFFLRFLLSTQQSLLVTWQVCLQQHSTHLV